MVEDSTSLPNIYDEYITIVASGATGENQLDGPISASTPISLPNSGIYTGAELEIYLSGQRLEDTIDYIYVSSGSRTQVMFTFSLEINDRIRFRTDRDE